MKIFTCTNFIGHWPVGSAALVIANDRVQAEFMLKQKLQTIGLGPKNDDHNLLMVEVDFLPSVHILADGEY